MMSQSPARAVVRITLPVCLALAAMGVSLRGQETAGQLLRWKFAEGDRFVVRIEQNSSTDTRVDVRTVNQGSDMSLTVQWRVDDVDDDGTAKIEQTITAIRATLTLPSASGPVQVVYDSSDERQSGDARQLAASMKAILDQPVTLTMTARGEITAVDIPEETMESLRTMPGSMEGREALSVESLREMFQSAGTEFPAEPVATGQSWSFTRQFSIGSPHQFRRETVYTLTDGSTIEFRSTLAVDSVAGSESRPDVEFDTLTIGDQQSGGTIAFDFEAGNVRESRSSTRLVTRTQYQGMEVSTTIDSSLTMTFQRVD